MRPQWLRVTVKTVADRVGGAVDGDAGMELTGISMIWEALPGDLVFIGSEKYIPQWNECPAAAALVATRVAEKMARRPGTCLVIVEDVDVALALVLEMIKPPAPAAGMPPETAEGGGAIHPSALVDPTSRLGRGVRVGAFCVVGPGVVVGDATSRTRRCHCSMGSRSVQTASCGEVLSCERTASLETVAFSTRTSLWARAGRPAPDGAGVVKLPHVGGVEIGNDVEIGANTCIDRGKLSSTVIGDFCKIDNLCQIGHNCRLGRAVIVAGKVGISGSVTIGDGVLIGGGAGVADHVNVGAGAQIAAAAGVMRDVPAGMRVSGIPARHLQQFFREQSALAKLPELLRPRRQRFGDGVPAVAPPSP